MKKIGSLIVAIFFSFICSASAWAALEKRVALVIGNGAYKAPLELPNPPDDGRAVAAALVRLGFQVIEGYDLTNAAMTTKLKEFSRSLDGADVGLFFYAGHGMQVAGENYLVPVDATLKDERDLEFEAVKVDLVLRQMLRDAKLKVVILDACRDNPLAAQISRSMGATRSRSLNPASGMAKIDAQNASGTLVAFATSPDTVALDGAGKHSPFTEALLANIETPGIDIDLMMKHVRGQVMTNTNQKQQPWTNSSLNSEFYLKPATEGAAPATAAAQPSSTGPYVTASVEKPAAASPARSLEAGNAVSNELRAQRADQASEADLALSIEQIKELNARLVLIGHDTTNLGPRMTPGTRKAIRAFQVAAGLVPTGYLNRGQHELLKSRSEAQYAAWVQQGRPSLGATASTTSDDEVSGPRPAAKSSEPRERSVSSPRPERAPARRAERPSIGSGKLLFGIGKGVGVGIGF